MAVYSDAECLQRLQAPCNPIRVFDVFKVLENHHGLRRRGSGYELSEVAEAVAQYCAERSLDSTSRLDLGLRLRVYRQPPTPPEPAEPHEVPLGPPSQNRKAESIRTFMEETGLVTAKVGFERLGLSISNPSQKATRLGLRWRKIYYNTKFYDFDELKSQVVSSGLTEPRAIKAKPHTAKRKPRVKPVAKPKPPQKRLPRPPIEQYARRKGLVTAEMFVRKHQLDIANPRKYARYLRTYMGLEAKARRGEDYLYTETEFKAAWVRHSLRLLEAARKLLANNDP